jgi:type IV secretory pathway component VirB8
MLRFFVGAYVSARESYSAATYEASLAFVAAHSDEAALKAYVAIYDKANPQSPAAILGANGRRMVGIQSIDVNEKTQPPSVTVNFTTELDGVSTASKTRWTAVIQYLYSDFIVTTVTDPETGEETLTTQDPQFQVVNYVLSKAP